MEEGPVDPLTAFVFFEAALVFADFDAGVALEVFAEVLATGLTDFAVGFALASGLAAAFAGLEVFAAGLPVLRFPATFFGTLLEPAVRASFFGAAGAFANWSSRRKVFPGITKTHVKSDKSV
jgi:hypothetical protein